MNIAICDDNIYMVSKLEGIVSACFQENENLFECESYYSGEDLLNSIKMECLKYHIYILDIEMKVIDQRMLCRIREGSQPQAYLPGVSSECVRE